MFSRAAKSIVKVIGQRKYHAGEENIKVTLMGGAGEIGRSLSQILKQTSKLNLPVLYDAASLNIRLPVRFHTLSDGESLKPISSWMLTMMDTPRLVPQHPKMRESIAYVTNGPSNVARNETEELVEVLRRLPVAEGPVDPLSKSKLVASQGDNACFGHGILRGPRVLGEMGPDNARQGARIVTEIYKQLPDLADRLGRDRTKRGNRPALRQLSTFTMSTEKTIFEDAQGLHPAGNTGEIPAKRASDTVNRKKKRDDKKLNATVASIAEKSPPKELEDRTGPGRKKSRSRKLKEHKGCPEGSARIEKRGSNGKSRNWTIPAALSDKKPKLLYGLVQQRRAPVAWFFSSLFENRKNEALPDFQTVRQHSKARKLDSVRERTDPSTKIVEVDRQEISASVTNSVDEPVRNLEVVGAECAVENVEEVKEQIDGSPVQGVEETRQPAAASSSSYETVSELSDTPQELRSISSKLWLFLENLRAGRRKCSSLSSLTSYHLDSLFEEGPPIYNRVGAVRFFSKSFHSKSRLKDRHKNTGQRKSYSRKDDGKKDSSCASGDGSSRKKPEDLYGPRCKKPESDCGKVGDVCRQYRNEKIYGASCKGGEDPCQKTRNEDKYGKRCKMFEDEFDGDDPLEKFWKDKVYGKRCKKKSNFCGNPKCGDAKCKKASSCGGKKKDSCGGKKASPCGGKKASPCGGKKKDSCGIKKKDSCGIKKKDSCDKSKSSSCEKPEQPSSCGKKPDPCGKKPDPCGKKPDPCGKKPDPCGKKPDPCGKKPDPCKKKSDPCVKKQDPCKKKSDTCVKKQDPCKKKSDPCVKKQDPCKKKSDPCVKKQDPCKKKSDPCKKKSDTCVKKPDPCAKKPDPCAKKPDPCAKKPDPCAKKPDPCAKKPDPCAKKPDPCAKKPDPCAKKPDPCAKKPDPCAKKADPCGKKKPEPCSKKKPDPCGKSGAGAKKDKGGCPPVFRAPTGCPEKGRKYSTDSRIHSHCSFSYNQDILSYPRIVDKFSMPELGDRIEPRWNSLNRSSVDR